MGKPRGVWPREVLLGIRVYIEAKDRWQANAQKAKSLKIFP